MRLADERIRCSTGPRKYRIGFFWSVGSSVFLSVTGISDARVALTSSDPRIHEFGTQANRFREIGDGLNVTV